MFLSGIHCWLFQIWPQVWRFMIDRAAVLHPWSSVQVCWALVWHLVLALFRFKHRSGPRRLAEGQLASLIWASGLPRSSLAFVLAVPSWPQFQQFTMGRTTGCDLSALDFRSAWPLVWHSVRCEVWPQPWHFMIGKPARSAAIESGFQACFCSGVASSATFQVLHQVWHIMTVLRWLRIAWQCPGQGWICITACLRMDLGYTQDNLQPGLEISVNTMFNMTHESLWCLMPELACILGSACMLAVSAV